MKAIWNGAILAESKETIVIEGNHYFPPESISEEFLRSSDTHTICHWKGEASYYDIVVGGNTNKDAAWYYPNPKSLAESIKGYIAFWKGVSIVE